MTIKPVNIPVQPTEPTAFTKSPLDYLVTVTQTAQGEASLVNSIATRDASRPAWHARLGSVWIDAVKKGLALDDPQRALPQNAAYATLAGRPLVQRITRMPSQVLVPRFDNFTPPERTPWGGIRIAKLKAALGVAADRIVGESWEISGHPSFPNLFPLDHDGHRVDIPLWLIGHFVSTDLYGPENVDKFRDNPPFLTKLLNSGSWDEYKMELQSLLEALDEQDSARDWSAELEVDSLSDILEYNNHDLHDALMYLYDVISDTKPTGEAKQSADRLYEIHRAMIARNLSIQIHPDAAYASKNPAWHAKTEMWVILGHEDGAGIYIGLRPGVTEAQMRQTLSEDRDISNFLNFVEVETGDVFFIPAGTPHAIGAGVLLLEQQETSETTFRYFSWWDGRELHVEDAIGATNWDAPRGMLFVEEVIRRKPKVLVKGDERTARHNLLAAEAEFSYDRVTFTGGDVHRGDARNGLHGVTVTNGEVAVILPNGATFGPFPAGQSFIIPARLGPYELSAPGVAATAYIGRSDPRSD